MELCMNAVRLQTLDNIYIYIFVYMRLSHETEMGFRRYKCIKYTYEINYLLLFGFIFKLSGSSEILQKGCPFACYEATLLQMSLKVIQLPTAPVGYQYLLANAHV